MNKSMVILFAVLTLAGVGATLMISARWGGAAQEVMTPKQKEHSKLYKQEYEKEKGQKLRDRAAATKEKELNLIISGVTPDTGMDFLTVLKKSACEADAVVVGRVNSKASNFTDNGEFIFTDYEMTVEEVLKDNTAARIDPQQGITITRLGGTLLFNGKTVTAVDKSIEPLKPQERYLLFLRFIPATGAYMADNSKGSFKLRNNKVAKLTTDALPAELEDGSDAPSVLAHVRSVIATACKN